MDKFKNVALSLAVIAGVTGLLFGATQAVWTDRADSMNNTWNTGNTIIHFEGLSDATNNQVSGGRFFDSQGMVPGQTETAYVLITNNGSTAFTFELDLENPQFDQKPNPQLDNVLEFQVKQVVSESELTTELSNWLTQSEKTLWVPTGASGEWIDFNDGNTLRQWRLNPESLKNPMASSYPITQNETAIYEVGVRLAPSAGNHYQERSFSVDIIATATQFVEQ